MTAQIIPFPEREHVFSAPCADPAVCESVFELSSAGTRTVFCTRCGKAGVVDATLDELNEAIAVAEARG